VSGSQLLLLGGTPQVASDPNFEYTTLLLPGNGTNGAQNNTFLDSSTNNFTITRNGNTTQGTFSPFSQTGWGNYFDGTGDYLTVANNVALQMSGDFTWEAWVYPLSLPGGANFKTFWAQRASGTTGSTIGGPLVVFDSAGSLLLFIANAASNAWSVSGFDTGLDVSLNQWQHIALVKSGTTVTLYKNGTGGTSTTHSTAVGTSGSLSIMAGAADGAQVVDGYMSNFRVVKGTAVYTSNFTPSTTPLTAITNTSLLTCQSNRFIDNSTNAFAITRNGDVSVQAFSPFNPTAAWSASTNGGSGYFDGSGDYLNTSSTQVIPSGSFTVEAWVYLTTTSSAVTVVAQGTSGTAGRFSLGIESSLWWAQIGSANINAGTPVTNTWTHLAVTFNGSTLTLYVNGVSVGTASTSTNAQNTTLRIGSLGPVDWSTYYWPGYIGQVRVSNTVRSISVPTALYTADANTTFLADYTNAGIYDATSKNDLETVGNAQISTAQSKFGGSSMYFDGTGDYLLSVPRQPLALGSGDWTVEAWVYLTAAPVEFTALFCSWNYYTSGYNGNFIGRVSTSNLWTSFNGQGDQIAINGTYSWTQNTWFHMAWVRFGSTITVYRDGVSIGSTTDSKNLSDSENGLLIGVNRTNGTIGGGSPTQYITGYVDDFRVTRGIARYTSNFTPPTTAFLTL